MIVSLQTEQDGNSKQLKLQKKKIVEPGKVAKLDNVWKTENSFTLVKALENVLKVSIHWQ